MCIFDGEQFDLGIPTTITMTPIELTSVPDAPGDDSNGVAAEFDEDNLGGLTFRVKIVVGN